MSASKARRPGAAEASDQRMELIGRLAGGVAHDMNNVLTVIQTYCEFLEDHFESGHPALDDVQAIMSASRVAAAMNRQLLAFTRREATAASVVDANDVVEEMFGVLNRFLGEDIEVVLQLHDEPCPVRVDPLRLEQALLNLCIDARDTMPAGGQVTISTGCEKGSNPHDGSWVTLSVSQSTAAGAETSRRRSGSADERNLRSRATLQIVEMCEGQLDTGTEPSRGERCFTIRLPRGGPAVVERKENSEDTRPDVSPQDVILVVDDDDGVRSAAHRVLEEAGHRVIVAKHPAEAIELARVHAGKVRAVLTDIFMPGMSGPELVRQLELDGSKTTVVYMSGKPKGTWPKAEEDRAIAFVRKPFRPKALLEALRGVLR